MSWRLLSTLRLSGNGFCSLGAGVLLLSSDSQTESESGSALLSMDLDGGQCQAWEMPAGARCVGVEGQAMQVCVADQTGTWLAEQREGGPCWMRTELGPCRELFFLKEGIIVRRSNGLIALHGSAWASRASWTRLGSPQQSGVLRLGGQGRQLAFATGSGVELVSTASGSSLGRIDSGPLSAFDVDPSWRYWVLLTPRGVLRYGRWRGRWVKQTLLAAGGRDWSCVHASEDGSAWLCDSGGSLWQLHVGGAVEQLLAEPEGVEGSCCELACLAMRPGQRVLVQRFSGARLLVHRLQRD